MSKHVITEDSFAYLHSKHINSLTVVPRQVWAVSYPSGWQRRSVMDQNGSVIWTSWTRPEESK